MKVHKWARKARELSAGVKGVPIDFQDGKHRFYVTIFAGRGKTKKRLIFRVNDHREYMDRFHWWFVQERIYVDFPESWNVISIEPATHADILRWMNTHYWTFCQKGFPLAKKWLKTIVESEYRKQFPKADPPRWDYNFKTGKVSRHKK